MDGSQIAKRKTYPLERGPASNAIDPSRSQNFSEGIVIGSDKLQEMRQNFPLRDLQHLSSLPAESSSPLVAGGPSIDVGSFPMQSSSPPTPPVTLSPPDNPSGQVYSALPSDDHDAITPTPAPTRRNTHKGKLTAAAAQVTALKSWPWRRWCLLAMVIALVISIPVGWRLRIPEFTIQDDRDTPAAIILSPTLVAIDPNQQTITMDWTVTYNNCNQNATLCSDIDIYFDKNLLRDPSNNTPASNLLPSPTFSLYGETWSNITLYNLANSPYFRTEIALLNGQSTKNLQAYPFDRYGASIYIYALDANITSLGDNFWTIALMDASGVAPGFDTKITFGGNTTDMLISMELDVSRGLVVRLYVIVIIISIWLITLTLLSMTVSVVFLGRKIASEILVVPVTTLFAFTQLRGTFPGAPEGFGAIVDFVGILPCLALLTFCSVFLLAVFLFRDPEVAHPPLIRSTSDLDLLVKWRSRSSEIHDISPYIISRNAS